MLAIRGGNHSAPGLGVSDDGWCSTCRPERCHVYPVAHTVRRRRRLACGAMWIMPLIHSASPRPAASSPPPASAASPWAAAPVISARKYGLTIDNLLAADLVLADGSFVTASQEENPDLFWALRGGGGNFGVVTSFLFRLHAVSTVYGGPMLWPFEQAAEILAWYREFIPNAPRK